MLVFVIPWGFMGGLWMFPDLYLVDTTFGASTAVGLGGVAEGIMRKAPGFL